SLSWLFGGSFRDGALHFPRGAKWFLSIYDESLIPEFEDAVLSDPQVCCGMKVLKIRKQETPVFGSRYLFKVGSPVLAKSKEVEGKVKHYTFADKEADEVMTATLLHKMDVAGLGAADKKVSVKFDRTFKFAKTKLVKIRNIKNRANECPVIIEGTSTAL